MIDIMFMGISGVCRRSLIGFFCLGLGTWVDTEFVNDQLNRFNPNESPTHIKQAIVAGKVGKGEREREREREREKLS
jgi:hypothetical protein